MVGENPQFRNPLTVLKLLVLFSVFSIALFLISWQFDKISRALLFNSVVWTTFWQNFESWSHFERVSTSFRWIFYHILTMLLEPHFESFDPILTDFWLHFDVTRLWPKVGLAILSNFSHKCLEWQLLNQKLGTLVILPTLGLKGCGFFTLVIGVVFLAAFVVIFFFGAFPLVDFLSSAYYEPFRRMD